MKKYEILEHPADLKIKVFGKDKKELFLNMLIAMAENQKAEKTKEKVKREIKIESFDLPNLLIDFLSKVLYLSQTYKEIYFNFKFKNFSENKIGGKLLGFKVKRFGEDIKAATYHDLDIHQKKDKTWEAIALFDI